MPRQTSAAVFMVHAWWDEGRFRARITSTVDLNRGRAGDTRTVTAEPEEVGRQLAGWLAEFAQRQDEID